MEDIKLELFWNDIPMGKDNAIDYTDLMNIWGKGERSVRQILHHLSCFDNGDNYILVRSASNKGFYRTDDTTTIKAYKNECLNKGKSTFAPIKKINRVLNANTVQVAFENNLRIARDMCEMKQHEVCDLMSKYDSNFEKSLLSKMENGVCLPTPYQLSKLAEIYNWSASDLVKADLYV